MEVDEPPPCMDPAFPSEFELLSVLDRITIDHLEIPPESKLGSGCIFNKITTVAISFDHAIS